MIFKLGYSHINFGGANGYIHKHNGDHYYCMHCPCYLVASWQLNIRGPWPTKHDYGYVEELYEILENINYRIDEVEERFHEMEERLEE